jgi:hypothetical protein
VGRVEYDAVVEAFFHPSPPGVVPEPVAQASPARRLRDAIEPIAMHAVWSRRTNERLAELGLDFLGAYVWGRAAALGGADAGVVVAAFATFEPAMLTATYEQARATCPLDALVAARAGATIESLGEVLRGADVSAVADRLAAAVMAADSCGRPLFGGLVEQPWPDDPVGRLWRACELAREHRGDSHVASCIASGLDPVAMNVLTELWLGMLLGSYTATRGWNGDQVGASVERLQARGLVEGDQLTEAGRRFREQIEATTDAMEAPIVDALGRDLDDLTARLDEWSARCIDAKAFPPDVFKRAAG